MSTTCLTVLHGQFLVTHNIHQVASVAIISYGHITSEHFTVKENALNKFSCTLVFGWLKHGVNWYVLLLGLLDVSLGVWNITSEINHLIGWVDAQSYHIDSSPHRLECGFLLASLTSSLTKIKIMGVACILCSCLIFDRTNSLLKKKLLFD